ncbi:FHA domain-containing protein [Pleurocapsales cyanobacterium LEGE 06147]|nr:FHA domain-containing protein [Pleurocapsales cyanobacterium LEGE 06147]
MIVCPNCNHHNPEGSTQCENCYTPLPQTTNCPNCGAAVQIDATFCGQCGYNLQAEDFGGEIADLTTTTNRSPMTAVNTDILEPDESETTAAKSSILPSPWDEEEGLEIVAPTPTSERESVWDDYETDVAPTPTSERESVRDDYETDVAPTPTSERESVWDDYETDVAPTPTSERESSWDDYETDFMTPAELSSEQEIAWEREELEQENVWEPQEELEEPEEEIDTDINSSKTAESSNFAVEHESVSTPSSPVASGLGSATQLQIQTATLFHVQTNTRIEIPQNLDVIHIGKPNSQIPPDIDVSGFPNSEIVSRIHADIRVEGDTYFIEDVGSSNGTYINHTPLLKGNRHRLRSGDRIALGKGDLVTFIFQIN